MEINIVETCVSRLLTRDATDQKLAVIDGNLINAVHPLCSLTTGLFSPQLIFGQEEKHVEN